MELQQPNMQEAHFASAPSLVSILFVSFPFK
jgi:hypothetical protein